MRPRHPFWYTPCTFRGAIRGLHLRPRWRRPRAPSPTTALLATAHGWALRPATLMGGGGSGRRKEGEETRGAVCSKRGPNTT
eukprot:3752981-Pyramimonas_sp.AAC.1